MTFLKKVVKRILLIMVLICSTFNVMAQNTGVDYSRLITAIGTVESGLNDKATNGGHAGFLQISQICVADCNRINKLNGVSTRYTLKDRFNHQKSIEMFYIIQTFYNGDGDLDYAVLLWNEGCSALRKPKRQTKYYKKVMAVYNDLEQTDK